jgi:hypothetical protein
MCARGRRGRRGGRRAAQPETGGPDHTGPDRTGSDRPQSDRPRSGRTRSDRPGSDRTASDRASDLPRRKIERADPDVAAAQRYGTFLALIFGLVGLLLLVLSAAGRGWPYLLGAVDFLVIAVVLAWALRRRPPRA